MACRIQDMGQSQGGTNPRLLISYVLCFCSATAILSANCVARSSAPSSSGPCNPFTVKPSGGATKFPPLSLRQAAMRGAAFPNTLVSTLVSLVSKDATWILSRAFLGILFRNSLIWVDGLPPHVGEPAIRRSVQCISSRLTSFARTTCTSPESALPIAMAIFSVLPKRESYTINAFIDSTISLLPRRPASEHRRLFLREQLEPGESAYRQETACVIVAQNRGMFNSIRLDHCHSCCFAFR